MGIPVTVILDSAVGYYMERVDVVLLGAEGVVESGGIVNKVGGWVGWVGWAARCRQRQGRRVRARAPALHGVVRMPWAGTPRKCVGVRGQAWPR